MNMYHNLAAIVSGPDYGLLLSGSYYLTTWGWKIWVGSYYLTTWGWKIWVVNVLLSSHVAYISLRATRQPPCQGICTCQLEGCLLDSRFHCPVSEKMTFPWAQSGMRAATMGSTGLGFTEPMTCKGLHWLPTTVCLSTNV